MDISQETLKMSKDDPDMLKKFITGGELWVYGYDTETKASRRPKKVRQVQSNVRVLLTVFCDCNGVVQHEFLPQGILP